MSYVLRLVDSEAVRGRLVGEIEDVRTGETRLFRNAVELAEVVRGPWHEDAPPTTEAP